MKTLLDIATTYGCGCNCNEGYTIRKLKDPSCPWHSLGVEEAIEEACREAIKADRENVAKFNCNNPNDDDEYFEWREKIINAPNIELL